MKGTPWEKWFAGDWKRDACVQKCSLSTKGAWLEMLNSMFSEGSDHITGTIADIGRLIGATESETIEVIAEIKKNDVATVTRHGPSQKNTETITLTSRRRKRELSARNSAARRAKKYRVTHESHKSNGPVTGERSDVRSQMSENRDQKELQTTSPKPAVPAKGKMDKPDPLEKLPILNEWFPRLVQMFNRVFIREPMNGAHSQSKARLELKHIAKLDNFGEREIIDTLTWWLESQDHGAEFWRRNCRTVHSLRKKLMDGTKFAQMFAKSKQGPPRDKAVVFHAPVAVGPTRRPDFSRFDNEKDGMP